MRRRYDGREERVAGRAGRCAAFWAPVYLAGEEALALIHLEWVLAVVAGALVSRALWIRRQTARELEEERSARERVTRERDEAELRSSIAGELHDSVGHDLAAIIALTEGLMGVSGDESLDEAVAGINRLAREGLADTRRAFRRLTGHEREICSLIADGLSNAEIAERLVIQPASAKRAVSRVLTKLGMRDRTQIAVSWFRAGL